MLLEFIGKGGGYLFSKCLGWHVFLYFICFFSSSHGGRSACVFFRIIIFELYLIRPRDASFCIGYGLIGSCLVFFELFNAGFLSYLGFLLHEIVREADIIGYFIRLEYRIRILQFFFKRFGLAQMLGSSGQVDVFFETKFGCAVFCIGKIGLGFGNCLSNFRSSGCGGIVGCAESACCIQIP